MEYVQGGWLFDECLGEGGGVVVVVVVLLLFLLGLALDWVEMDSLPRLGPLGVE